MPARLVAIPYSPWSEKARWALDHHRIPYDLERYHPVSGEPALRWRLGRGRGPVSVPVLLTEGSAVTDSFDIAQYAERHGHGVPLFRRGWQPEIEHWNDLSEQALAAGRALHLERAYQDANACQETLPQRVPGPLRRPLVPVARAGIRYIQVKYGIRDGQETQRSRLLDALLRLRHALSDGRTYLLGELSYADLAMATALHAIQPVDDHHVELGPATRRSWTDLELASELNDLVAWRDQLYQRHRGVSRD